MEQIEEVILGYLATLKNAGIYNVCIGEIGYYLKSIGLLSNPEVALRNLRRKKSILLLSKNKITLNPRKYS